MNPFNAADFSYLCRPAEWAESLRFAGSTDKVASVASCRFSRIRRHEAGRQLL
jgi:hypothetical protein